MGLQRVGHNSVTKQQQQEAYVQKSMQIIDSLINFHTFRKLPVRSRHEILQTSQNPPLWFFLVNITTRITTTLVCINTDQFCMFSKHHLKYSISLSVPGFSFLKLYDDLSALVYEVVNHLCFGGGLVTITCQTLATPRTVACQLLCPWDSSGKNTEVCCHFLLQELNLGLLPFRQILYPLSYEGRLYHFSCKL